MDTWLSLKIVNLKQLECNDIELKRCPTIEQISSIVYLFGSSAILWLWLIYLLSLPWYHFDIEYCDGIEFS
jgi:hypothetical protein